LVDFLHMTKEERAYIAGQWDSYNRVLAYLNTLDTDLYDKTEIYKHIFSMRPEVTHGLYDQMTVSEYLYLIDTDIEMCPERLLAIDSALYYRIVAIVKDITVDLNAKLSPEDE
jgi:hypothetical protein